MLNATNISFGYDTTPVLRGVTVDVPEGGLVGILGPNGSGKTTLLRLLAGHAHAPTAGRVTLDGDATAAHAAGGAGPAHGGRAAGDAPRLRLHGRSKS